MLRWCFLSNSEGLNTRFFFREDDCLFFFVVDVPREVDVSHPAAKNMIEQET